MTGILETLLWATVSSGVLFAAIMLFKQLFRRKLSPFLGFALWAVLLVRLCIPFTIDSGFHFITLPQEQTEKVSGQATDQVLPAKIPLASAAVEATNRPSEGAVDLKPIQIANSGDSGAAREEKPVTITWQQGIFWIWIGGVAFFAIKNAAAAAAVKRKWLTSASGTSARTDEIFALCKKHTAVRRRISLVLVDGLQSPALTVSFRPRILLPREAEQLSCRRLYYALCHELTHYRRKDHLIRVLMQILRTFYWFDPFVWLAFREMRIDMEAACDADVVRRASVMGRKEYARTVIEMASRRNGVRPVLGIASSTKKTVERRVHGILENKKSSRATRCAAVILSCLLGICCFTTACRPARTRAETDNVVSQTSLTLADSVEEESAAPVKEIDAPDRYMAEIKGLPFPLRIDAEVVTPEVPAFPVKRIVAEPFTQDEADRIREYFLGDTPLYEAPREKTKDHYESELRRQEYFLEHTDNANARAQIEADITRLRRDMEDAPELVLSQQADTRFQPYLEVFQDETPVTLENIQGIADMDNGSYTYFSAGRQSASEEILENHILFANYNLTLPVAESEGARQAVGQMMTPQEAQNEVERLLGELGISDMEACAVRVQTYVLNEKDEPTELYHVLVKKQFADLPGLSSYMGYPTFESSVPKSDVLQLLSGDNVTITLGDEGIVQFCWRTKASLKETVQEDSVLLPFDHVAKIFEEELKNRYGDVQQDELEYYADAVVDRVELGYVSIEDPESPNEALLQPAWLFYMSTNGQPSQNAVNISAIDGTILYG